MTNERTRETKFHIRQFERNNHYDNSSGNYRRGRIFLFDSEYDLDQQYIRTGNYYVTLYTIACVNDHNDIDVVLLLIGFVTCGKEFGAKTVYTSLLLPVYLAVFEHIFPDFTSLTNSSELDVICYILVVSIGLSILFNMNASSGGLDIVAKIMNKYLHIELGKAMSLSGMCVALSSALIYDKKAVVLSVLGTYFNGIVLDHFIFGQNVKRRVCIITKYEEEVRQFILHELHSGATFYEAMGAYNMQKYREIITIVDKNEYQKLMNYIIKKDPEAFVTVYTVSDMRYRPKVKSF